MMPEFVLRGPYGAYSTADLFQGGILLRLADRIHELIADPEFEDYLFVFGTVIAARNPDDPRQPWEHVLDPKEIEYYNFAPVYRGGSDHTERFLVTKRYISLVDFLDRTSLPNPASNDVRQYGHIGKDFEKLLKGRDVELVQDNDFEIDGLKIGLEICLDHRLGMLWSNLQKDKKELVDVLLVTSAGMAIERGPNPVVPGGVVYLSDGEASSAACLRSDKGPFDPEKVCRSVEIVSLY
jgi:predicted amidohydrolase